MSVQVIIPFYGSDPVRHRNLAHVVMFYRDALPEWTTTVVEGTSLAATRNRAGFDSTASVLVFNDADTLCPPEQIREAVRLAQEAPGRVACFDIYQRLTRQATETLGHWSEAAEADVECEFVNPPSNGCMAIRWDSFVRLGGYDESFHGWGYEDCEFNYRNHSLYGTLRSVPGEAYHLWHSDRRHDDSPLTEPLADIARNLDLYHRKVPCSPPSAR